MYCWVKLDDREEGGILIFSFHCPVVPMPFPFHCPAISHGLFIAQPFPSHFIAPPFCMATFIAQPCLCSRLIPAHCPFVALPWLWTFLFGAGSGGEGGGVGGIMVGCNRLLW